MTEAAPILIEKTDDNGLLPAAPSVPDMDKAVVSNPWKCSGCGSKSIDRERTCRCPTECLYRTSPEGVGLVHATKTELDPPIFYSSIRWAEYEDEISDAITDSMEMDWTSRDGARAIVQWLETFKPDAEGMERSGIDQAAIAQAQQVTHE